MNKESIEKALKKAREKADEILAKREDYNEYHFHDVERKWIIQAMMDYAEYCLRGKAEKMELSDEEIEKASKKYRKSTNNQMYIEELGFKEGMKHYREKIKEKYGTIA